jgi:lipopolysaccharide transport system permease protein
MSASAPPTVAQPRATLNVPAAGGGSGTENLTGVRAAGTYRTTTAQMIQEIWGARELVVQFIRRDITVRYTQAVMGFAWALLMPMLVVGAGLVFRLVVSNLSGTKDETSSVASLMIKALPWTFFSAALSTATQSILAHANLIGKVYFARESLPLAAVLGQAFDLLVGLALVAVALPFLHVPLTWALLWAPVLLLLLVTFTVGCALILSCANLFYRDVKYLVQVILNFGVFATPVFFAPEMLGAKFAAIMLRLPLSPFIQGLDVAVIRGHNLMEPLALPTKSGMITVWTPSLLVYATALALGSLVIGLRVFRRGSAQFAEMA